MSLKVEVERFREWAATHPKDSGEWECDYDAWSGLLAAAESALSLATLGDSEIELLLFTLARDNECEFVRHMLEEHPSNALLLAAAALTHPDRDARWQIADFLGTQTHEEARLLLRQFFTDENEYVRRRALLASAKHDRDFAEATAWQWVSSTHEYSRLASLSVLHELESPHQKEALDRLRNDPSEHVRNRVVKIEEGERGPT